MAEDTKSARAIWRGLVWIGIGLLLFLVLLSLYHGRKQYHAYAVINQQDVSQGSLVGYEPFQQGYLKYSKDGVSYISEKNDTYWTSSFEMKDPVIDVNGSYAVIADRSGNTLQIFDEKHGKSASAARSERWTAPRFRCRVLLRRSKKTVRRAISSFIRRTALSWTSPSRPCSKVTAISPRSISRMTAVR